MLADKIAVLSVCVPLRSVRSNRSRFAIFATNTMTPGRPNDILFEEYSLVRGDAVQSSINLETFWRNVLSPSSG
jgi:hypothetical protein